MGDVLAGNLWSYFARAVYRKAKICAKVFHVDLPLVYDSASI